MGGHGPHLHAVKGVGLASHAGRAPAYIPGHAADTGRAVAPLEVKGFRDFEVAPLPRLDSNQ